MRYARIVFMQGEDADEALAILDNQGVSAAIDHLAQWDMGDDGEFSNRPSAGTSDRTYKEGVYLLTWNVSLNYIGLERMVK